MENPTWTPSSTATTTTTTTTASDDLTEIRNEESDQEPESDQRDFDPAKKYRWDLIVGQGERSLYEKKFPTAIIKRISRIQVALAIGICVVQITIICLIKYNTSVEFSGASFWGSLFTILAAKSSVRSTQKLKLKRLMVSMALHVLSIIGSLVLFILILADSIPSQKYRLFSNDQWDIEYRGPLGIAATCFVWTASLAFAGLAQLIMSMVVLCKATQAACTRSFKLKYQVLTVDSSDVTNETKPPAYDEI